MSGRHSSSARSASAEFFTAREPYQRLSDRKDVLVYQTEPLAEAIEVTGRIPVELWIASTAVDTDFTAKLIDVHPSGFCQRLTDSVIRARYRNSPERAEFLEPGEVYEFTIIPYPTSNVFARGHRIRVDVSSSNFPRFDVNPNTGEPLGRSREPHSQPNVLAWKQPITQ